MGGPSEAWSRFADRKLVNRWLSRMELLRDHRVTTHLSIPDEKYVERTPYRMSGHG
jgi:hypothetical protein